MLRKRWYRDAHWLTHKYVLEGRSQREIAKICGCTHPTVLTWLKRHGIPARSVSEGLLLHHRGPTSGSLPGTLIYPFRARVKHEED